MTTFTVPARMLALTLRAVLPHASTDKTLPILNSVRFRVTGGELMIDATDRYSIGRATLVATPGEDATNAGFVLPLDDAKRIVAAYKTADQYVEATVTLDGVTVTVKTHDSTIVATTVESEYPQIDRIVEGFTPAEAGTFGATPKMLEKFAGRHIARDAREKSIPLVWEFAADNKPARVTFGEWFVALVMPTRF